jgi:hypothetical protein
MKKGLLILITISVFALSQIGAKAEIPEASYLTAAATGNNLVSTVAEHAQPLQTAALHDKLAQATQLLKARAQLSDGNSVTLAVLDPQTSELQLLPIQKDSFLTKGASLAVTSQSGRSFFVTVVRANGVNTAVRVSDASSGRELTPLTVAFPIVKGGTLTEIAYYSSAHPALVADHVASAGETYISSMLDHAAEDLDAKGVHVPADIVEIAEHLCVVEHTDHKRFITEDHKALLPEIVSLYALNQGNTFRYSVSTAGAGGMIQMIRRTYEAVRQQHPAAQLQADFVSGMRDHGNALKAMLLYMNDTWTKLDESSEVQDALRKGIATKPELMAAGYNSNPVKLPTYLKNGGSNWRTLIPAETQMYLAIYGEVDRNIGFAPDSDDQEATSSNNASATAQVHTPRIVSLLAWFDRMFTDSAFARVF